MAFIDEDELTNKELVIDSVQHVHEPRGCGGWLAPIQ